MKTHIILLIFALLVMKEPCWGAAQTEPEVTFTRAQVEQWIAVQAPIAKGSIDVWKTSLDAYVGGVYPVSATQLKEFLALRLPPSEGPKPTSGRQPIWPIVRAKYSDTLSNEDPTVSKSENPPAKADSVKGASFSFTHNFQSADDKWQVNGALIVPIVFRPDAEHPPTGENWAVDSWGFIPSVSVNETRDAGTPANDVDSLIYRVGIFSHIYEPSISLLSPYGSIAHQFRGFGTYGTDLNHRSSVPAGEFDWEPQLNLSEKLAIGYRKGLMWRTNVHNSIADDALVAYQVRTWFHGEFGQVLKNGAKSTLTEKSFSRVGPSVELSLDPLFHRKLSFNVSYQYYADLSNFGGVPYTFETSLIFTIWENAKNKSQKASLKANYTDGGQDITRIKQRLFTLGVGFTY